MTNPVHPAPVRAITESKIEDMDSLISEEEKYSEKLKRDEEEAKYAEFNKILNQDNFMSEAEFSKYIPLFKKSTLKKITDSGNDFDSESSLITEITELSNELYHRINPQRPIHVTDSAGTVLYTLPPLMRRLNLPANKEEFVDSIQAFMHHTEQSSQNIISHNKAAYLATVISEKVKEAQYANGSTSAKDVMDYAYMADRFNIQRLIEQGVPIAKDILLYYFPEYRDTPELDLMVRGNASGMPKPSDKKNTSCADEDWDDDDLFG